jgi:hypothetical protein
MFFLFCWLLAIFRLIHIFYKIYSRHRHTFVIFETIIVEKRLFKKKHSLFSLFLIHRYIEGLQTNTHYISPYEKTLKATQETVQAVDISKLPTSWLGKRAKDKPEEVVNALWELRNYMMKDILQLHRTY